MPLYGTMLIELNTICILGESDLNLCIKIGSPSRRAFFMSYSTSEKGVKFEKNAHFNIFTCGKCFYKVRTSEKQSAGELFLTRLLIPVNVKIYKNAFL